MVDSMVDWTATSRLNVCVGLSERGKADSVNKQIHQPAVMDAYSVESMVEMLAGIIRLCG